MSKIIFLFLLSLITTSSFASPCVQKGSCFKLNNQYQQPVSIICHNNLSATFKVLASGNSQGSTQFDSSLNDGLGYPGPDQLNCKINISGESQNHNVSFYNPFWGPTIEFNLLSSNILQVIAWDRWRSGKKTYDFNW